MGAVFEADRLKVPLIFSRSSAVDVPRSVENTPLLVTLQRQIEIFPYRQIRIDRRGLKFPADAELDDFILALTDEFLILAENDPARQQASSFRR